MKILVVTNAAPFLRGGAEALAENLVTRINARKGLEAELLRIPFKWEPAEHLVEEMLLCQNLKLWNVDRVIAMKFPAYLIPHHEKHFWLVHQFRQAYDLRESGMSHIGTDPAGEAVAGAIRTADARVFREAKRLFTIGPVVSQRLKRFNGIDSEVLHHPLNDPEVFGGGSDGGYLFAGGRVGPGKRQHLLVEAAAKAGKGVRLVVAGPPESEDYAQALRRFVAEKDLADRIDLRLGFLPREEIVGLINGARACAAAPIDEDSISYVAMEAMAAGKPMVTTTDAGGLLEVIRDGQTGRVVEPSVAALATAMAELGADGAKAGALGRAARALWDELGITWETRIARLLS